MPRFQTAQRGVLFTFLTFLFIGVLIGLVVFNSQLDTRASNNTVEVSVLGAINAKYDDITDDVIVLDNTIGVPTIQQRILPFTYQSDLNSITFNQTLPITSGKLALYYDLLNAYAIFVNDPDVNRTFDGVNVDLRVPKSPAWGGSTQRTEFNILPQCVQYIIADSNAIHFESQNTMGCANTFNLDNAIQRIDITLSTPPSIDDYNLVACSFDGNSTCPHSDFNADAGPYLHVQFVDANCANCVLSASDKNISAHITSNQVNSIAYSCVGSNCDSSLLTITTSDGFRILHDGTTVSARITVTFRNEISLVYFQDANYTVTKKGFNTSKSNVVVFPQ